MKNDECAIRYFFNKDNSKCDYAENYPSQFCVFNCAYYEKYQDLIMDAKMIKEEIARENGYDEDYYDDDYDDVDCGWR